MIQQQSKKDSAWHAAKQVATFRQSFNTNRSSQHFSTIMHTQVLPVLSNLKMSYTATLYPIFGNALTKAGHFLWSIRNYASYVKPMILKKPQHLLTLPEDEKKHRKVSAYSANITASLALPERVTLLTTEVQENKEQSSKIGGTLNFLHSFFKTKASIPEGIKENIIATDFAESVEQQMLFLEQCEQLLTKKEELDAIKLQKVELVAAQIKEHAARRVDLFFYLLLAVYRKNMSVEKTHTIGQHGKGSKKKGTQACHSSLFPGVKFEPKPAQFSFFQQEEISDLEETHFKDGLDMTVELPHIVNVFDGYLEGKANPTKFVKYFQSILNKAANNEMTPHEAMNHFFAGMKQFFDYFEQKYLLTNALDFPQALKKVWEYEKMGTFLAANKDFTVKDDYLYLMLRLTPAQITKVKYFQPLLPYYEAIQQEIYTSKYKK